MTLKQGFIKHRLGDRYIVVATGALAQEFHCTVELNETAAFLWDGVAEGLAPKQLADRLATQYEIPMQDAMRDTENFLAQMQNANILTD